MIEKICNEIGVTPEQLIIKQLQQENQQLKNDINKLQKELNEENLQCSKYSIEFNDLKEKNKQLRDNWNKLKKYIDEANKDLYWTNNYDDILCVMQELEQGSDNNV